MNISRILVGGLVATLIIAVSETLIFAVLLAEPMAAAAAKSQLTEASWGPPLFLGYGLVLGTVLAWLYAAIRPRFGPGPFTALKAGAVLWLTAWLTFYVWLAPTGRGLLYLEPRHTAVALLGELTGVLLAALAVGWIYRERSHGI